MNLWRAERAWELSRVWHDYSQQEMRPRRVIRAVLRRVGLREPATDVAGLDPDESAEEEGGGEVESEDLHRTGILGQTLRVTQGLILATPRIRTARSVWA